MQTSLEYLVLQEHPVSRNLHRFMGLKRRRAGENEISFQQVYYLPTTNRWWMMRGLRNDLHPCLPLTSSISAPCCSPLGENMESCCGGCSFGKQFLATVMCYSLQLVLEWKCLVFGMGEGKGGE